MLLEDLARASAAVAETASRLAKVRALADCLRRLRPEEVPLAVAYLSGELPHAPIGVGWAALRELPPAAKAQLHEILVDAQKIFGRRDVVVHERHAVGQRKRGT